MGASKLVEFGLKSAEGDLGTKIKPTFAQN